MESPQFRLLSDRCLARLSQLLCELDPDALDVTEGDGFLALEFEDGARFMVSRQSATSQIWLAAAARAWHFSHDAASGRWKDDKDGEELGSRLSAVLSEKLGRTVNLGF